MMKSLARAQSTVGVQSRERGKANKAADGWKSTFPSQSESQRTVLVQLFLTLLKESWNRQHVAELVNDHEHAETGGRDVTLHSPVGERDCQTPPRQLGSQCSLFFSAVPVVGSVEEEEFESLRVCRSCLGRGVVRFCTTTLLPLAGRCCQHHGRVATNELDLLF